MLFMSLKCLKTPGFVLADLSEQLLLLPTICFPFFLTLLLSPSVLFFPPLRTRQLDLVLLFSPHALIQVFAWLQLLLRADDSQMHSAPLTVCHPGQ